MDDRQKENSTRGTAIAAMVAALGLLFVVPDLGARKGRPCREQSRAERHPGIDDQEQCPAAGRAALTETAALRL